METLGHRSVLVDEVIEHLSPRSGGTYIDATLGLGGHAEAILEAASPDGRLLGIDRDPEAIARAQKRLSRFGARLTVVEGHFSDVHRHAEAHDHLQADGVVADLGVSSIQLDDPSRGFSFQTSGPLDMRMGPTVGASARELLDDIDVDALGQILRELGEVDRPKAVARAILAARDSGQLDSTDALARVVERASGPRKRNKRRIHPATKTFQAIRVAVNRELDELDRFLEALPNTLRPGGVAALISFHSLEDRRVKHAFRGPEPDPRLRKLPIAPATEVGPFEVVTRRPVVPSEAEIEENPRARSAKLRVARNRGH